MRRKTVTRALAVLLLTMFTACVNTPSGYRAAPIFDDTSLLTADPAALMFAEQSNVAATTYTLDWVATLESGAVLSEDQAALERVAQGQNVEFGLPPARDGQTWTLWKIDDKGRESLRELQQDVKAAKADGKAGTFSFNWAGKRDLSVMPEIMYMTHAARLSANGTWFTIFDNMAIIPEKNADESRTD